MDSLPTCNICKKCDDVEYCQCRNCSEIMCLKCGKNNMAFIKRDEGGDEYEYCLSCYSTIYLNIKIKSKNIPILKKS